MRTINLKESEAIMLDRYLVKLKQYIKETEITKGFDDRAYDINKINLLLMRIRNNNYKREYVIQRGE